VHVSQVRSVDLDRWEVDTIEFMKRLGNIKVNQVYEHSLPAGSRISASDARAAREKWIRQKYDAKEWADPAVIQKVDVQLTEAQKVCVRGCCSGLLFVVVVRGCCSGLLFGVVVRGCCSCSSNMVTISHAGGGILQGRLYS
jgi:hypothetical protein